MHRLLKIETRGKTFSRGCLLRSYVVSCLTFLLLPLLLLLLFISFIYLFFLSFWAVIGERSRKKRKLKRSCKKGENYDDVSINFWRYVSFFLFLSLSFFCLYLSGDFFVATNRRLAHLALVSPLFFLHFLRCRKQFLYCNRGTDFISFSPLALCFLFLPVTRRRWCYVRHSTLKRNSEIVYNIFP